MSERALQEMTDRVKRMADLWQTFVDDYDYRILNEPESELIHWYKGRRDIYKLVVESLQDLLRHVDEIIQEDK